MRRFIPLLAALSLLGFASQAQAARYCGARFVLNEQYGVGASDFSVTNVSCHAGRHVVDQWFKARTPHHIGGWTFSGRNSVTARRGHERIYFSLFGAD